MESVKQAANYAAETVQGAISGASKETNKEIAKDSNASVGTRQSLEAFANHMNSLTAAKDAVGDSINESGHNAKADVHKEAAKN
ncbi:hypothetical protein Golomagni_07455 [Golovinomyces magnicellulatus]|nr:hypothetical protein Golomagni_07455 [Golovinomyces magnicellulatus]